MRLLWELSLLLPASIGKRFVPPLRIIDNDKTQDSSI